MNLLLAARRFVWPLLVLVLLAFTAFFTVSAVKGHSDAQRSARIQKDGIRVVGTVASVTNHRTTSNINNHYRWHYTADVTVALRPAVEGHDRTTLHFRRQSMLPVGQALTVLLDPEDLGHAQLPGGGTSSTQWNVMTGAAVGAGVLALVVLAFVVRGLRRRGTVVAIP